MKIRRLHPWDIPPTQARRTQDALARCVREEPLDIDSVGCVAGADASYSRGSDTVFAAVVLLSLPGLEVIEEAVAVATTHFPYVPGLLAFREGPALIVAFEKLRRAPDLVLFDGQGVAHPRGLGIASHLGLILDTPSIGCAKSLLVGSYEEPGGGRGSTVPLRYRGRPAGMVVRTRTGVAPVFVSVGHLVDLAGAVAAVLRLAPRFRLPEPMRRAHALANRARTGLAE